MHIEISYYWGNRRLDSTVTKDIKFAVNDIKQADRTYTSMYANGEILDSEFSFYAFLVDDDGLHLNITDMLNDEVIIPF